jgi:hypothetical protein
VANVGYWFQPVGMKFFLTFKFSRHLEKNILLSLPLNPASTENFFFEFWSDFSVCSPFRPLDMRSERKFFLSIPEV